MSERLGFADAVKRISFDIFDESVDPLQYLLVFLLPVEIFAPAVVCECDIHSSISAFSKVFPSLASFNDRSSTVRLFAEPSR